MTTDLSSERSLRSSERRVTEEGFPATPRVAERRVAERRETRRTDPAVVAGQILEEVRRSLDVHAESKNRRTLMGKLQRLDTAVARRNAFPPHDDQVAAMLDVLSALQASIPVVP